MIVVMEEGASEEQVQEVIDRLIGLEFSVHRSTGQTHTVIGGVGNEDRAEPADFEAMAGVKACHRIESPFKLAHRHFRPEGSVVTVRGRAIGGPEIALIAGPSVVEGADQIGRVAEAVAAVGGVALRGCCSPMRPGTVNAADPERELEWLRKAADAHGLAVLAEAGEPSEVATVASYADIVQVSSVNMQNFRLLAAVAACGKPVLLKRGVAATAEELLLSAEYLLIAGNHDVVLCESGIRTFDSHAPRTMDIGAIPTIHKWSHLPVVADPCRGTGRRDRVMAMALAAAAAGADGLVIELHPDPDHARADGGHSLSPAQFAELAAQVRRIGGAIGRGR